jgi:flagellar biosynthetic protein FlhB
MADKTEAPSSQRLSEARTEGQVVNSHEVNSAIVLLISAYLFGGPGRQLAGVFSELFRNTMVELPKAEITFAWLQQLMLNLVIKVLPPLGMIMVTILIASAFATLLQTQFLWSSKRVGFDFKRVDPISGFKRMFSSRGWVELLKALLKLLIVGWVVYNFLKGNIPVLVAMAQMGFNGAVETAFKLATDLAINVGGLYLFIAATDYAYQRWDLMRSLKMSKEELKEEYKRSEGDPLLKGRIRAQMRRMARGRMMANVPKSTVIVTNPTHLAIAIQYQEGMEAPKVLAKGAHKTAERIIELARDHSIPIVQNIPLARAMFKHIEVDQEISADLYLAMAEVLAYVYRLRGRVPTPVHHN